MSLPFTVEQFLNVFATYNKAVWPVQVLLNLIAIVMVYLCVRQYSFSNRLISIVLGCLWLWMGLVYHITFFSAINPAASGFGVFCVIEGLLFIWIGIRSNAFYKATLGWRQSVGSVFIVYALLIYPFLGMKFGHVFPSAPTFGAPCPTTIFTMGILLWATKLPRYIVIIPLLWSFVGFTAAWKLGIYEDVGLLITGLTSSVLILTNKSLKHTLPSPN
jgi:hypothetical protein